MSSLRALLRDHRSLTLLVVGLALLMKALVPAGYMIGAEARVLTVEICADASGGHLTRQIVIPSDGKARPGEAGSSKTSSTCPFASMAAGTLLAAPPVLLALALAFILLLGLASIALPARRRPAYLRPPLRAPPVIP